MGEEPSAHIKECTSPGLDSKQSVEIPHCGGHTSKVPRKVEYPFAHWLSGLYCQISPGLTQGFQMKYTPGQPRHWAVLVLGGPCEIARIEYVPGNVVEMERGCTVLVFCGPKCSCLHRHRESSETNIIHYSYRRK